MLSETLEGKGDRRRTRCFNKVWLAERERAALGCSGDNVGTREFNAMRRE